MSSSGFLVGVLAGCELWEGRGGVERAALAVASEYVAIPPMCVDLRNRRRDHAHSGRRARSVGRPMANTAQWRQPDGVVQYLTQRRLSAAGDRARARGPATLARRMGGCLVGCPVG